MEREELRERNAGIRAAVLAGASYREAGAPHGLTGERVRQLVGVAGIRPQWRRRHHEETLRRRAAVFVDRFPAATRAILATRQLVVQGKRAHGGRRFLLEGVPWCLHHSRRPWAPRPGHRTYFRCRPCTAPVDFVVFLAGSDVFILPAALLQLRSLRYSAAPYQPGYAGRNPGPSDGFAWERYRDAWPFPH